MAFEPTYLKNVDLIFGVEATGTNFKCQVNSVKLTPDADTNTEKALCPEGVYSEVDDPEWTLEVGYLAGRDKEDATKALSEFMRVNHGKTMPFTFRPYTGEPEGGFAGVIRCMATEFGGEQGSFSKVSAKLPVIGQPTPLATTTEP
ncbi:hypothetical protein PACID_15420 [Acidipropionibacterium acidipropionici ATCC 4875]|uniref:Phage tail protein n=1 Tax=Acidipropionibacterium acidipropionici (strain ATCC 4875 / DSM 20272 / JCM 6432 / NBRC 12425 / NCIMB 8070 / 4) TaxID=1171373 RepID=K7SJD1_ACIA4|nr:hypothetical protein [Acidipropionibacterium acidipropionici]AFV89355.1 hypothetical protein PACID_15420 [Acidipropionibacterium acidipropionici ATCC 4875]